MNKFLNKIMEMTSDYLDKVMVEDLYKDGIIFGEELSFFLAYSYWNKNKNILDKMLGIE